MPSPKPTSKKYLFFVWPQLQFFQNWQPGTYLLLSEQLNFYDKYDFNIICFCFVAFFVWIRLLALMFSSMVPKCNFINIHMNIPGHLSCHLLLFIYYFDFVLFPANDWVFPSEIVIKRFFANFKIKVIS